MKDMDICSNKHGGAETSVEADATVKKQRDRAVVLGHIKRLAAKGTTLQDLCGIMNRTPNQLSGRLTELRVNGFIYHEGTRSFGHFRSGRVYFPKVLI